LIRRTVINDSLTDVIIISSMLSLLAYCFIEYIWKIR
jgi:hypothetical protein